MDMKGKYMKRTAAISFIFVCLGFFWSIPSIFSQDNTANTDILKQDALKIFIDCRHCDEDFIRTEITFVNHVRDRLEADVHLLITEQGTGSGGREYTLNFIGRNAFEGRDDTLTYISNTTDTRDETRRGLVEVMKRGLFPFVMKTPIADHITLKFNQVLTPTAVRDKWNFWVFSLSMDGRFSGEQSQSERSLDANISANRVTPEVKIRMGLSGDFERETYDYEDEHIVSTSEEIEFDGLIAKSIGDHWSAGGWLEASSSTYDNIEVLFSLAPALEYNFFRYSESTRRQLRCLYRIGFNAVSYREETIFEKTKEILFDQSLRVTLESREPWGNISLSLEGSHYFHDFSKYRFELWGYISLRIFRGLSVTMRGRFDRIHDQLSLPLGEATLDEVLLQRRELATDYDYSLSMGLSYTFGSVFTNVVNPRFGGRY